MKKKNLYEVLGIPENASDLQVRDALLAAERSVVAATSNEAVADAENRVKFARQAFAVLGNHASRAQYDERLKRDRDLAAQISAATSEQEVSAAYARHDEANPSSAARVPPSGRGRVGHQPGDDAADRLSGAMAKFASDPVGELGSTYDNLGASRAAALGAAFGAGMSLCITLAFAKFAQYLGDPEIQQYVKVFAWGLVPFLAMSVTMLGFSKLSGADSALSKSVFIAGTALFPVGVFAALSALLGIGNIELIAILAVVASCLGPLILFSGCREILGLGYRASTWAVPIAYCLSIWITNATYTSVLERIAMP